MPQDVVGKVYLVGAGPGDPGLITLRGVECLRRADVVLYDYLVNPDVLCHVPRDAQRVCLGRHGKDRIWPQEEINQRMVDAARQGRTVVRLKGGDPAVFAHAAEEVDALTAAGIAFEIVPGITAALAAGSHAGVPITHRDLASAVALITGQERSDKPASSLDYRALAAFPGTLVFYMGVTTAKHWTTALIEAGKPAETPTAIVRRCSWPDQMTVRCTLSTVADELQRQRIRPPVIVIVGEAVGFAPALSWFASRPLFGTTVLVTRSPEQADSLARPLAELGADVRVQPAIEIDEPLDWAPVDRALRQLDRYDWLVFSSSNAVRYLMERLFAMGRDMRALAGLKIATIGPGTAEELARWSIRADRVPGEYRAESLADALTSDAAGKRFLLARASRGREVLAERLLAAGATIEPIVVYTSRDVPRADAEVAALVAAGKIDWITVTSSAIARSLAAMFGDELRRVRLVSISPVTSATLRELGLSPAAEATSYTMAGVVDAIRQAAASG